MRMRTRIDVKSVVAPLMGVLRSNLGRACPPRTDSCAAPGVVSAATGAATAVTLPVVFVVDALGGRHSTSRPNEVNLGSPLARY